jgi:hypothetical protein
MKEQIRTYIATCIPCLRSKTDHSAPVAPPAGLLPPASELFDRIHVDLVLGFPLTPDGYKGLLTIMDSSSKFARAYPIKSKTADEIALHLFNYISIFGPPRVILSDNGSEFVNSVVAELSHLFGVERAVTSPYHPSANGLVERFNQTITAALRAHSYANPARWPSWIDYVLFAYNTRPHSATRISPYAYVFGRDPPAFVAAITDPSTSRSSAAGEGGDAVSLQLRAQEIRRLVESTRPRVHERIGHAARRDQHNADTQHAVVDRPDDDTTLLPGQTVWVRLGGHLVGKMASRYAGPYTVVRRTDNGAYVLRSASGAQLSRAVRRDRLKVQRANSVVDDVTTYRVETILSHRTNRAGRMEYYVKWLGYPIADSTWEPEDAFVDLATVDQYWSTLGQSAPGAAAGPDSE